MESVTFITEPLLHPDFVQFEVVVPILERLTDEFDLTIAAPQIAPGVRTALESRGIHTVDGGAWFPPLRRSRDEIPSYVGSWARDVIWGLNGRILDRGLAGKQGLRVNISMTTSCDADVWIIQSRPLGLALDAIRRSTRSTIRTGITLANPFVGPLDERHVREMGGRSRLRYSSTQHVADWFEDHGVSVQGILPIYYRPSFHPSAATPTRDYLVVYLGKETDATAVRLLLDTGIPVRMFGSKSPGWVRSTVVPERYPNAKVHGRLSDAELCDLYSNARFTAFPFTEESFGLIPLESMACGTPVLTYNVQGPAESVLDGETGWLVGTPEEFAAKALELWKNGYPTDVPGRCLERAQRYQLDSVVAQWREMLRHALESRDRRDATPTARSGRTRTTTDHVRSGSSQRSPSPASSLTQPAGLPSTDPDWGRGEPSVPVEVRGRFGRSSRGVRPETERASVSE